MNKERGHKLTVEVPDDIMDQYRYMRTLYKSRKALSIAMVGALAKELGIGDTREGNDPTHIDEPQQEGRSIVVHTPSGKRLVYVFYDKNGLPLPFYAE